MIAVRALARDALRRQDYPRALSWSEQACAKPSAEFSDRLLRLQTLFVTKSPGYETLNSDLEKSAFEDPQLALELGRWKVNTAGPLIAATWLESAPDRVRSEPDLSVLLAECYSALNRWDDLEIWLSRAHGRRSSRFALLFLRVRWRARGTPISPAKCGSSRWRRRRSAPRYSAVC